MDCLREAVEPGGFAIIGTFAPDGPERCSGLPIMRHDARTIAHDLGKDFALLDHQVIDHLTPTKAMQKFQFSTFQRGTRVASMNLE